MNYYSRLLPVLVAVVVLSIGLPVIASGQSTVDMGASSLSLNDDVRVTETESVVLKRQFETHRRETTMGASVLRGYAESERMGLEVSAVNTASFNLNGVSTPLPQSEMSTKRKVLYIVGGVVVVGGAVAGILALGGDDGAAQIPAPPGRP